MEVLRAMLALLAIGTALVGEKPAPVVTPPKIIEKRAPEYTERARVAGVEGTVRVKGELDENGRLTAVQACDAGRRPDTCNCSG